MSTVVAAARDAVGARFRLHGRDPALGLDCVGLVVLACRAGGFRGEIPVDYPLRGGDPTAVAALIERLGLTAADEAAAGDIVMCATGPGQLHLAIDCGGGLIHADAMLRRVVERPGPAPWPIIGRWRLAAVLEE